MARQILKVAIFAIAFGFVEAAVVAYLHHLVGLTQRDVKPEEILFLAPGVAFLEPQTAVRIIRDTALFNVERIREGATLIMLAAVAALSGRKLGDRIAFFFLVFGIWDIFYYIFLRLIIGWPMTLFDLDIFFLLPTPWVGPVLVPIVISSILVLGSLFYLLVKERSKQ